MPIRGSVAHSGGGGDNNCSQLVAHLTLAAAFAFAIIAQNVTPFVAISGHYFENSSPPPGRTHERRENTVSLCTNIVVGCSFTAGDDLPLCALIMRRPTPSKCSIMIALQSCFILRVKAFLHLTFSAFNRRTSG